MNALVAQQDPTVTPAKVRQYRDEGYLVLRAFLDPDAELARVREAYVSLMDTIGEVFLREAASPYHDGFPQRPMPERFGLAMGASGGAFLDHLDPVLRAGHADYVFRSDLPTAQIPEMFELMRAPRLLDAMEALLGPEIEAGPLYHVHSKLGAAQVELANAAAGAAGRKIFNEGSPHAWHLLQTNWHMDAPWILADARATPIVTTWIPMSECTPDCGALMVVPGSHRRGLRMPPFPAEELKLGIPLETGPGDVILFDNRLLHASAPINDPEGFRWAFNFRYLPAGQPNGRPYLPGFLARSARHPEKELRDAELWAAMWRSALAWATAHVDKVPPAFTTGLHEARAFTRRWQPLTRNPAGWQELARTERWRFPARRMGRWRDRLAWKRKPG